MYFNRETRGAVLASLTAKLCDRGYLVLGHADSRADLASAFEVFNDDLGIYRKRAGGRL
jgi:chemotaxis methyl-accepting protein methylase